MSAKSVIIVLIFGCALHCSNGETVFPTECGTHVYVIDNLNSDKFGGMWFEQYNYLKSPDQENHECRVFESVRNENGIFEVSLVSPKSNVYLKPGTLTFADKSSPNGRLIYTTFIGDKSYPFTNYFLGTDYDSYLSVYSCGGQYPGMIFTRTENASEETIEKAKEHFTKNDVKLFSTKCNKPAEV